MQLITRKSSLAGVELPAFLVEPNCKACPAFHIKGTCKTGCGNTVYHVAHNREQMPPPLWMGLQGNAIDHGALGAGHLGNRQGIRTCAPCSDHKPRPVCEDVCTHQPLHRYTVNH